MEEALGWSGQLSPHAAPADALPGPLGRHQVVGAIRRLLLAAAPGRDVLLRVDDLHLADDADVAIITQLAASGAGLCLLLGTRPPAAGTALARAMARLQRSGVLQALDVEPLPEDECRRLVARAMPGSVPDDVVSRIVRAAEGNPFAAIELARCAGAHADGRLPGGVAEAITERLCDVPDSARRLLEWMALGGDELDVTRAPQVLGLPTARGQARLNRPQGEPRGVGVRPLHPSATGRKSRIGV